MATHNKNSCAIQYLYDYYKGKQPVLWREKKIRPEINNKIVVNRANEIVTFKVGYLMGEPVQYVCGNGSDAASDILLLNSYMADEDKAAKDREIVEWNHICGTAYRMVLPKANAEDDESPFHIYTLDPRYTFVVYSSGLGNRPMMAVKYVERDDGIVTYSVYTDREYYEIENGVIKDRKSHALKAVPIIEYPANTARIGAFEMVVPLLDAINKTESNRLDGVEQFIQSLMVFKGINIDSADFQQLKDLGGICISNPEGDIQILAQQLDQQQTQTLINDMYDAVLTICGMPNRNGGSSTSDTGEAVIYRDGWSSAESRAKDSETIYKSSEHAFLRLALRIVNNLKGLQLKVYNIKIQFTRRNYENIQIKSQVLTTMLASNWIHPRLAYEHCGMFSDPEAAYKTSEEYHDQQQARMEQELARQANIHDDEDEGELNDAV